MEKLPASGVQAGAGNQFAESIAPFDPIFVGFLVHSPNWADGHRLRLFRLSRGR
jgi:hypothetical protein